MVACLLLSVWKKSGRVDHHYTFSAGGQHPAFAAIHCKHSTCDNSGIMMFRADLVKMPGGAACHWRLAASEGAGYHPNLAFLFPPQMSPPFQRTRKLEMEHLAASSSSEHATLLRLAKDRRFSLGLRSLALAAGRKWHPAAREGHRRHSAHDRLRRRALPAPSRHKAGRGRQRHRLPVQPAGLGDRWARPLCRLRLQRDGAVRAHIRFKSPPWV
jgi:hypothetical protein